MLVELSFELAEIGLAKLGLPTWLRVVWLYCVLLLLTYLFG